MEIPSALPPSGLPVEVSPVDAVVRVAEVALAEEHARAALSGAALVAGIEELIAAAEYEGSFGGNVAAPRFRGAPLADEQRA